MVHLIKGIHLKLRVLVHYQVINTIVWGGGQDKHESLFVFMILSLFDLKHMTVKCNKHVSQNYKTGCSFW
jgi:hypothetical protein